MCQVTNVRYVKYERKLTLQERTARFGTSKGGNQAILGKSGKVSIVCTHHNSC